MAPIKERSKIYSKCCAMTRLPSSPVFNFGTPSLVRDTGSEKKGEKFAHDDDEEEVENSPLLVQKVGAELVGTFILVFLGCGSAFVAERGHITHTGVAATSALALTALIYTLGHVSGAHFNPAVTVAFAAVGKFPWREVPWYVMSQVVSATLACELLQLLFDEDKATVMLTLPGDSFNDLIVITWEIVVSFILMWVICGTASDHRAAKELAGLAIGAALFANAIVAGKVSGASMNPARSLGAAIATRNFHKIAIYLISPVIGTICAAAAYNLLHWPGVPRKIKAIKPVETGIGKRFNPAYLEESMDLP